MILVLLWLFEIVLLDDFYENIRISRVKLAAETISGNIKSSHLEKLVGRFATEEEMCISIVDHNGRTLMYSDVLPDCVIHRTSGVTTSRLYSLAESHGGSWLETIDRTAFRDEGYDDSKFFGRVPNKDSGMSTIVIYTVLADVGTQSYGVIINTNITPISATVNTLRTQLLWITVIMAVVGLVFSWFISVGISKPIADMTASAAVLATGDYDVDFTGGSYRETKDLADALNYAAGELKKVDALKSELIANVSHDLKTPLTMIRGYAEMIRDFPADDNDANIQVIIDETEHLTRLVNDILDLSKMQSSAEELNITAFNITDLIHSIIGRYSELMGKNGYNIVYEYDEEAFVKADEVQITQVIYNLINNAINYCGEDKTVIIRQTVKGENVLVEVTDHGSGIPEEKLRDIWDRYYKVNSSVTHKRSLVGTGLGLSIVKSILVRHNADFGVRSTVGEGSTFYFSLKKTRTSS